MTESDWINVPENIEDYVGFVYLITNFINGKKYIGKKFFWRIKKLKPLKGKKNKRHFKVQSDWKDYWGSSNALLLDVQKYGKNQFKREILHVCTSKFECSYQELLEQIERKVLFDDMYYNEILQVRLRRRNGNI